MSPRQLVLSLCAAALLGGCEHDLLKDLPDASAPDAAIDAHGTMDVHGVGRIVNLTDTGPVVTMMDLSAVQFTTTAAGGERHAAMGAADGTFVVPVGAGAATWDLGYDDGIPWHIDGNATTLDIGVHRLGRPDAATPILRTPISVHVTGLAPWSSNDQLQLVSSNAGAYIDFIPQILVPGDTSWMSIPVDWPASVPLVDAGRGDQALLFQLSTQTTGASTYTGCVKAATATGFSQIDGMSSTLTVALADVPQKTIALHWKRSQFEALRAQVGPATETDPVEALVIDALPGLDAQPYGWSPDLVVLAPTTGTSDLDLTFAYGNPFVTNGHGWDEFASVDYHFVVPVAAPGATPQAFRQGYFATIPLAALATDGTIAPVVSGVRNLAIAGHDAMVPQAGVGVTPMIAWDAPALGAITGYQLEVDAIEANGGTTTARQVALIDTKATSVVMPEGVLVAGSSYVISIAALVMPGTDFTAVPLSRADSIAVYDVVTAQFSP